MKLCQDCKHFRAPEGSFATQVSEYAKCEQGLTISPVTGNREMRTQTFIYCIGNRQSRDMKDCGADGKHFECGRFLDPDDEENLTRCGDEGRLCEVCFAEAAKEHAWMRGKSQGACTGILSETDKQDLRDAGRGHLVLPS